MVSVLACSLLMAAYEEDENWPEIFVKVSCSPLLGVEKMGCRERTLPGPRRRREQAGPLRAADGLDALSPVLAPGGSGSPAPRSCSVWGSACLLLLTARPSCSEGSRSELPGAWTSALSPQVYIEDSLGERIWVDSPHCKAFVDNIQTAFNTRMPPKSMLLQGEAGRGGGDLSAGEKRVWLGRERLSAGGGAGVTPARSRR